MSMFPRLGDKTLSVFIPFGTTYLCESGLSMLLSIKTKLTYRLNAQADMRIALSNKAPRFDKLTIKHKEEKGH